VSSGFGHSVPTQGTLAIQTLRVVYTDPRWAVNGTGSLDPALADIERDIYRDDLELDFGIYENGAFVLEGPRLLERVRHANGLMVLRTRVGAPLLEATGPKLRVVCRQGVGFDNLDLPELKRRGIFAFNVPDYCTPEVSDHALALTLALERRIVKQNAHVKGNRWRTESGGEPRRLGRHTFGIVGFGRIGRAVARKAAVFYGKVQAYDPFVSTDAMAGLGVERRATLEELLATSDVVSIHTPLDDSTWHLLDRKTLPAIKSGALLINTGRGGVVEPDAVLFALESGQLGGYGSDVFNPEDPNADPVNKRLLDFENVVVTAHSAFWSADSIRSIRTRIAEEFRHVLLTGDPPRFGRLT
jgi:phosphoglycerate dehydrogenase-like enzyme